MKFLRYLAIGILFGIVMTKSEAVSWYRIQEMFRFHALHMYLIIGSALMLGVMVIQLIKRKQLKTTDGQPIQISPKNKSVYRYTIGGLIFGMGWALTGACPGPVFTLVGSGYMGYVVVAIAATLGGYLYGLFREKLPH